MITEIGGTVGDIESLPFLEAIRQFPVDVGRRNCLFIHLTLVPYIGHAGELKTKPTQHSVNELRRIGIQPDMLLCRSESELSTDIRKKIALFASLPVDAVVSAKDVDNIYEVPLWYHEQRVDDFICETLGLEAPAADLTELAGRSSTAPTRRPAPVRIALVGKYVQLEDAYKSVTEALRHSGYAARRRDRDRLGRLRDARQRRARAASCSRGADGILVPGGFGGRGIEGKIRAVRVAREQRHPVPRRSASACRWRSASSRATSPACRAPTRRSSTSRPSGR